MGSRAAAFLVAAIAIVVLIVIVVVIVGTTQLGSPAENAPPGAGSTGTPDAGASP